jgi:hypothetical protein
MSRLIVEGAEDPWLAARGRGIIRAGGVRALRGWLATHWRDEPDPWGVELVRSPGVLLGAIGEEGAARGDCDDAAVLGGALAAGAGLPVRLVVAGWGPAYSHVWAEAWEGGGWAELDVTRPPDADGAMLRRGEWPVYAGEGTLGAYPGDAGGTPYGGNPYGYGGGGGGAGNPYTEGAYPGGIITTPLSLGGLWDGIRGIAEGLGIDLDEVARWVGMGRDVYEAYSAAAVQGGVPWGENYDNHPETIICSGTPGYDAIARAFASAPEAAVQEMFGFARRNNSGLGPSSRTEITTATIPYFAKAAMGGNDCLNSAGWDEDFLRFVVLYGAPTFADAIPGAITASIGPAAVALGIGALILLTGR